MTGREHYAKAEELLDSLNGQTVKATVADTTIGLAQAHATLALFDLVREIGDQLDTLPRHLNRAVRSGARKARQ